MKTENHETQTRTNGEHSAFKRYTEFTGLHSTSEPGRLTNEYSHNVQELKERLSVQLVAEYGDSIHSRLLRQVINEADSLASTTPFPSLFLPALAEEKVQLAQAWSSRQRAILEQTWALAE